MKLFDNRGEREVALRLLFLAAVVVFCVAIVFSMPVMLASVLISAVLAYSFFPLVNRMEAHGMPRWLAILIIYVVVGAVFFLVYQRSYTGLVGEFSNLQIEFPIISTRVLEQLKSLEEKYAETFVFLRDMNIVQKVHENGVTFVEDTLRAMPSFLSSLTVFFILVPLFTFFLLRDGKRIRRWILDMLPNRYLETGVKVIFNINKQMEGFIQARLLEIVILGITVYIGLAILGLKYVLFLSVFAAIFTLIPYIGPVLGAVPGVAIAYFYSDTTTTVWLTIIVYTAAQLIDAFLTIPIVFSKRMKIHPMMVIILIIIGAYLMGVVGMILAVPIFCILKVLFDAVSSRIIASQ